MFYEHEISQMNHAKQTIVIPMSFILLRKSKDKTTTLVLPVREVRGSTKWSILNQRLKNGLMWVCGLVVKTDGYSAEGPEFDSHSGCLKYQYIRRVIFTLSHTSLVSRPEFKLEWVLWGLCWSKLLWPGDQVCWYLFGLSVSIEQTGVSLRVLWLPPP